MDRCPICRARWSNQTVCRRCGVDLEQAIELVERASELGRSAMCRLLNHDDPEGAARLARRAALACSTPLLRVLPDFLLSGRLVPSAASPLLSPENQPAAVEPSTGEGVGLELPATNAVDDTLGPVPPYQEADPDTEKVARMGNKKSGKKGKKHKGRKKHRK